jgi:hypothetical protein
MVDAPVIAIVDDDESIRASLASLVPSNRRWFSQAFQPAPGHSPYTWVRLAQRVPVRIAIDEVPLEAPLVSGMTATITIRPIAANDHRTWFDRAGASVEDPIADLLGGGRPLRANCLQAASERRPETEAIPVPKEPVLPSPETIEPGLTSGLDTSPQHR